MYLYKNLIQPNSLPHNYSLLGNIAGAPFGHCQTFLEGCEVAGEDGGVDVEERLGGGEGHVVHVEQ